LAVADAVVFVTTSSRYGDASPWKVLHAVADKPLVVVINRLQTRASGARNYRSARLRGLGLGSAPVLTISEQRVDPEKGRLRPQSVQRLAGVLKDWASQFPFLRTEALERAADDLTSGLGGLVEHLEDMSARAARAAKEVTAAYEAGWEAIEVVAAPATPQRKLRWRSRRSPDLKTLANRAVDEVDHAALMSATALQTNGFDLSADLQTASRQTARDLSRYLIEPVGPQHTGPDHNTIRQILDKDRQRFLERLMLLPDGVLERLHNGADLIGNLDWRSV